MAPRKTPYDHLKEHVRLHLRFPPFFRQHGRMADRERLLDIRQFVNDESPVIVDGGAFIGSTVDMFLKLYPRAEIHAIEPIPELATELETKFSGRSGVKVHRVAIGSGRRKVSLNVTHNLMSSSLWKPSSLAQQAYGGALEVNRVIEVAQERLDQLMTKPIDILKLDLQGGELEALKGCGAKVREIRAITVEVEFEELYEGQPLFADIDQFLRTHGFRLFNLYDLHTHRSGQLSAGDALYLNRSISMK